MTAKVVYFDEVDRKLILETRQKLEEITRLMEEILEIVEILSDLDMMETIHEGLEDVRAGRVTELYKIFEGRSPYYLKEGTSFGFNFLLMGFK
jgi:hypothetical protein